MLIRELLSTEEEAVVFFQPQGLLPVTKLCEGRHAVKYFGEQYPFWKCNVKPFQKKLGFRVGTWFEHMRSGAIRSKGEPEASFGHLPSGVHVVFGSSGGDRFDALLADTVAFWDDANTQ
ncbi:hypothetical protein J6590_091604 [Homalodisca vitripennis]|nr:hypothetical protein J6590_091604 [Homalodisca vitripennis]